MSTWNCFWVVNWRSWPLLLVLFYTKGDTVVRFLDEAETTVFIDVNSTVNLQNWESGADFTIWLTTITTFTYLFSRKTKGVFFCNVVKLSNDMRTSELHKCFSSSRCGSKDVAPWISMRSNIKIISFVKTPVHTINISISTSELQYNFLSTITERIVASIYSMQCCCVQQTQINIKINTKIIWHDVRGRSDKYLVHKRNTKNLEKWRFISQHSLLLARYTWPSDAPTSLTRLKNTFSGGLKSKPPWRW